MSDNELRVLESQDVLGKTFRIYGTLDEPLFLAKDVAEWIENSDPRQMVELVDENEKLSGVVYRSGQNREMWFLTEDGLYEVLMQSRKPIAKAFKKRVKEILKTLRKRSYQASDSSAMIPADTDALIQIARQLHAERERNARLLASNRALCKKNTELALSRQVGYPTTELSTVQEMVTMFHARNVPIRCRDAFYFLRTFGYIVRDAYGYIPTERSAREGWIGVQKSISSSGTRSTKVMITSKGIEYFFGIFKLGHWK